MLVLKRKKGERIIVGDKELIIEVVELTNGMVRLGFETENKRLAIHREEVYEDIKENGQFR